MPVEGNAPPPDEGQPDTRVWIPTFIEMLHPNAGRIRFTPQFRPFSLTIVTLPLEGTPEEQGTRAYWNTIAAGGIPSAANTAALAAYDAA